MKHIFHISIFMFLLSNFACQNQESTQEKASDAEINTPQVFTEKHRPQFHFSPPAKWMNDPNGMVYYDGEYHLFYQHYPDSTVWGPMHWGHAVSTDLIHWEHLPIALYPDSLGYIFSGSAVVDWKNSSGLSTQEAPPLVAIFTHHDPVGEKERKVDFQSQSIAFSNDKGRTWTKYQENPVIPNPGIRDFRDPTVFWDQATEKWLMVFAAQDRVKFYSSLDLKDWEFESDFGKEFGSHDGVWECPDLFKLPVEGKDTEKWVLLVSINPGGPNGGSATQYFIGDFDGKTFIPDEQFTEKKRAYWVDYGTDNYAGVTWSDIPKEDGRRIFIGWMSNWTYAQEVPTDNWRSAMTLPRRLFLKNTVKGLRLCSLPVKELEQIIKEEQVVEGQEIKALLDLSDKITGANGLFEVELDIAFDPNQEHDFGILLSNNVQDTLKIGFENLEEHNFYIDRSNAGEANFNDFFASRHQSLRISEDGKVKLRIIMDVASVELFADQGEVVMTDIFFPQEVITKAYFVLKIQN